MSSCKETSTYGDARTYGERSTRDLVLETTRDVKWVCRALERIEKRLESRDEEYEARLRALEQWRALKAGEERRHGTLSAGAGGIVGGAVAVMVRIFGGG
ncbi:MAG: hypothetical protein D5R99_00975 [Methanocalculus sp. MSAO_Arc1]|nr:MAG: hypothetical protein D5R99_00975 [Methanocalculus sp. MSAO_Arc1]